MASVTSICNSALAKIGAGRIISIDDPSEGAKLCKEQYTKNKEDLIAAHPWNFAIARVSLAQLPDAPVFQYKYAYQIPVDCLRVLQVNTSNSVEWEREGSSLVTDSDGVYIRYIKNVDESLFSPLFAEVLAVKLAYDISYSLVQSVQLREQLRNDYKEKLREARSYDAQEGGVRQVQADEFILPRY